MKTIQQCVELDTATGVGVHDITPQLRELIMCSGIREGFMIASSRHTTTAITINEHESRLIDDLRLFLHRLIPPTDPYLHNDIHLRDCPADEPLNAHSHIAAMLLGQSETVPVAGAKLRLGTYQSVLLVDLDGPRRRRVNVQIVGE